MWCSTGIGGYWTSAAGRVVTEVVGGAVYASKNGPLLSNTKPRVVWIGFVDRAGVLVRLETTYKSRQAAMRAVDKAAK